MKRLTGILLIGVSLAITASAAPPERSATGEYKFVGFSATTVPGDGGFGGMLLACQDRFGPDARMATTVEVSQTNVFELNKEAWVQAVIVNAVFNNDFFFFDATGAVFRDSPNCTGWSAPNTHHAAVVKGGNYQIVSGTCDVPRYVACAAPQ